MRRAVTAEQAFDRADRLAVHLPQHGDAGIHRLVMAVGPLQHHGAGATVALGAALLGAAQPAMIAQPVEQRRHRRQPGDIDRLAVECEANVIRHAKQDAACCAPVNHVMHSPRQK
jgi:hypothetical protein